jgi:hypothetical protein
MEKVVPFLYPGRLDGVAEDVPALKLFNEKCERIDECPELPRLLCRDQGGKLRGSQN